MRRADKGMERDLGAVRTALYQQRMAEPYVPYDAFHGYPSTALGS